MLALAWWGVPRARARRARPRGAARRLAPSTSRSAPPRLCRAASAAACTWRARSRCAADILHARRAVRRSRRRVRATPARGRRLSAALDTRATLVVVHDRAEAWALADRLLILIGGELVAAGPPRELLEHPPSPAVARFLGYDGMLRTAARSLLTRPAHVALDPAGPLRARVDRAVAARGRRAPRARARPRTALHGRAAPRPTRRRHGPRPCRWRRSVPAHTVAERRHLAFVARHDDDHADDDHDALSVSALLLASWGDGGLAAGCWRWRHRRIK